MKKLSVKLLCASLFIVSGAFLGSTAKSQDIESVQDCTFCYYGEGCKPTSLSNTCVPGPPCSNQPGCSGC